MGSLIFSIAYCVAYGVVRTAGLLVHHSCYRTQQGIQVIDTHKIRTSDLGVMGQGFYKVLAFYIFTPLRWAEGLGWYIINPSGSSLKVK